jgi:NitT/TauT family transport system substrate-binding protein
MNKLLSAAVALTMLAAPVAQADPVTIKAAWAAVPGQMFPILMQMKDVLVHYGKSYTVEAIRAPGSGPQTTALATGDISLAYFAPAAFALAIQNAHMSDLRLIGVATRDGYQDYFTRPFAVLADSPIKKVEDLKGKVIGDNSIGGAMDIGMRAMLHRHGLEDKRDYSVVEIEFPNMMSALTAHRVDLGFLTTPFSVQPMKSGTVRALFTQKDAMEGPSELTIIAARTPYIAANRGALVDYFEDTNRALRWILEPKNRQAAIKLVADFTKQPAAVFSDWIFTKGDDYHAPDSRPDLAAMQKNLDIAKELGLLKENIDVKAYSDLSLVDEAAARVH